ncbi:MAG: metal-sulfur cluster assembly factor [Aquificae bacterium]|nr:metal-sulfur cluster assembly factor [Aquificota bacterium]
MIKEESVLEALKEVCDPEIPLNLVDLGLVKDVTCDDDTVKIEMTLTTPKCPLEDYIINCVKQKIKEKFPQVEYITVNLSFDEVWKPEKHISEEGKKKLRELGWDI